MITYNGIVTQSASTSSDGVVTAKIVHSLTASNGEGPFAVGRHALLPRVGLIHPENNQCWCISGTVELTDPKTGYTVTALYSSEREVTEDPLAEPVSIDWGTEQYQKPLVKDRNGNATLNTAGDPFNPPVMIDANRWGVHISCNVAAVPSWVMTYPDAENEDAFTVDGISVGIGQAKIQNLQISRTQRRNDIPYRVVSFSIQFKEEGWNSKPLSVGFREINAFGNRQLIVMTNDNGEQEYPVSPVMLDENGFKIDDPTPDNAYYHNFEGYNAKPFAVLPGINT